MTSPESSRRRGHFRFGSCAVAFCVVLTISPRQAPTGRGTSIILGEVVEADSRRPVGDVFVTLSGAQPAGQQRPRVITDSNGRFFFDGLASGVYNIAATKPGYVSGEFGKRRPSGTGAPFELGENERVRDIEVLLWRYGSLSGRVLDDLGDPIVGAAITVLKRIIVGGRPRYASIGPSVTNDRGEYRKASLTPGDYVVALSSVQTTLPPASIAPIDKGGTIDRNLLQELIVAGVKSTNRPAFHEIDNLFFLGGADPNSVPSRSPDGRLLVSPALFFPQARALAEAQVISIQSGIERSGIDFRLGLVPGARLSGVLNGLEGPMANTAIRLVPTNIDDLASELGFETATGLTDAAGAFTLLGVPEGQYTLRALSRPAASLGGRSGSTSASSDSVRWASEAVTVGDADVSKLVLTMHSGVRINGRVLFEGSRPQPDAAAVSRVSVALESARPFDLPLAPFVPDGRGLFASPGLRPGRYFVRALGGPVGWTFKSATVGSRDITDLPIELNDTDIDGVALTFVNQQLPQVSGAVRTAHGVTDVDAAVLLFPRDPKLWLDYGPASRRLRSSRVSRVGAYTLANLQPGEYFLLAIDDAASDDWRDPPFLNLLIGAASRVDLRYGENKSVDLRTVQVKR